MAAPRVEEYVTQCFAGTKVINSIHQLNLIAVSKVSVEVQKGQEFFEREYPCLAAVNRCASTVWQQILFNFLFRLLTRRGLSNLKVPRHDGRVIWLTYKPEGTVKKTVYLVRQLGYM